MKWETDKWPFVRARWQRKPATARSVRVLVIHSMEAPELKKTAENVARYFQITTTPASAHICVDSDSIVQCVLDSHIAYGANGVNHDGIQIELAGYARQTRAEWLDAYGVLMLDKAANAAAQYCLKYSLPPIHITTVMLSEGYRGIVGHNQATAVYRPNKGHWDPGLQFPWDFFIERVERHHTLIQRRRLAA